MEREIIELKYRKLHRKIFSDVFGRRAEDSDESSLLDRSVKFELVETPKVSGNRKKQHMRTLID